MLYLFKKHIYSLIWTIFIILLLIKGVRLEEGSTLIAFVFVGFPFIIFLIAVLTVVGVMSGIDYVSEMTMSQFMGWLPLFRGSNLDVILSYIVLFYMILFWTIISYFILFRSIKNRTFFILLLLHAAYWVAMFLPILSCGVEIYNLSCIESINLFTNIFAPR